ncbi:MAG: queuosine precursor transporter [Crocinitomicaceae bacterium]|nr:queuosine precursor transporter [Crocinitomicaceae bacterium]
MSELNGSKTATVDKARGDMVYLVLAGTFIGLLITCNLIFKKFIEIDFFGVYTFEISAGVLPYPLTFLITDLISELFGLKKANKVVFVGLIVSVLVMLITLAANAFPAIENSPLTNEEFEKTFGLTGAAVASSMIAYLIAQFVDVRIYHFWKRVTKGKHLWLRNNFSTLGSQLIDTTVVLLILCGLGVLPWDIFWALYIGSFLFKFLAALLDTPLLYLFTALLSSYIGLKPNEEYVD